MCIGIAYDHAECSHRRKYNITEPCNIADTSGQDCCGNIGIAYTVLIYAPSLCVNCFRRKEDRIFAKYARYIESLEKSIEDMKVKLERALMAPEERKLVELQHYLCKEGLVTLKEERKDAVAEFREQQGVWRDG